MHTPNNEQIVFDPIVVGNMEFRGSERIMNLGMIAPYVLEAKYPHMHKLKSHNRAELLVDLLSGSNSTVDEAVLTIKALPDQIKKIELPKPSRENVEKVLSKFDIQIPDLTRKTVSAIKVIISDFGLPTDSGEVLLESLDNVQIGVNFNGGSSEFALLNSDKGINVRRVDLDLVDLLDDAQTLAREVGTSLSREMIEAFFVSRLAHELGHTLDSAPYFYGLVYSGECASVGIPSNTSKYPLVYLGEDMNSEAGSNKMMNWRERFAAFFEVEVVDRLGLPTEAISDFRRLELSRIFYVLSKVDPAKLSQLLSAVRKDPDLSLDNPVRIQIEKDLSAILDGHTIANVFPFSKEEILSGFLSSIQTPLRRLYKLDDDKSRLEVAKKLVG